MKLKYLLTILSIVFYCTNSFTFSIISCFSDCIKGPISYFCDSYDEVNEYLIFLGNPGVGKSTLINSLIGENVAESGVNAGIGLTKFFTSYEHNGKFYLDTPGLADVKLREQAAREIENALKKNGKYRIFFVITLQAGRVRPEDITTINSVLHSINIKKISFNIIINQVKLKERRFLENNSDFKNTIIKQINSGVFKTSKISFINLDLNLENNISEFIELEDNIRNFIYLKSEYIYLKKMDVGKLASKKESRWRDFYAKNIEAAKSELERQTIRETQLRNNLKLQRESLANFQRAEEMKRRQIEARSIEASNELRRRQIETQNRMAQERKKLEENRRQEEELLMQRIENEKKKLRIQEDSLFLEEHFNLHPCGGGFSLRF